MSPNVIAPSTPFTVSYYIPVNTDTNTYYVQAIIYDALTGEILDTFALTRQTTNTRLFSKRVQAPGDSSSLGRRIVVVATAYTNSSYTVKSQDYQDQAEVYLVKVQSFVLGGGGSGNSGGIAFDYVKFREILKEELIKIAKVIKADTQKIVTDKKVLALKDMPFDDLFETLNSLKRENLSSKDLSSKNLEKLLEEVKKFSGAKATEMKALAQNISSLSKDIEENHNETIDSLNAKKKDIINLFVKLVQTSVPELEKEVADKEEVDDTSDHVDVSDLI